MSEPTWAGLWLSRDNELFFSTRVSALICRRQHGLILELIHGASARLEEASHSLWCLRRVNKLRYCSGCVACRSRGGSPKRCAFILTASPRCAASRGWHGLVRDQTRTVWGKGREGSGERWRCPPRLHGSGPPYLGLFPRCHPARPQRGGAIWAGLSEIGHSSASRAMLSGAGAAKCHQ